MKRPICTMVCSCYNIFSPFLHRVLERSSVHGPSAWPVFSGDQGRPETGRGEARRGLWGYHGTRPHCRWKLRKPLRPESDRGPVFLCHVNDCWAKDFLNGVLFFSLSVLKVMVRTRHVRPASGQVSPTLSRRGAARWCVAPDSRLCVWELSLSRLESPLWWSQGAWRVWAG